MPRWVVADDNQDEASTSEEDSIEEEDEGDEGDEEEDAAGPSGIEHEAEAESEAVAPGSSRKRDKISIPLGKLVCHVRSCLALIITCGEQTESKGHHS